MLNQIIISLFMEFIKTNWEGIIAIAALLSSFFATYVSFRLMRLKEIHFVKSVKPMLQIGQWDYENCLRVTLKNCGIGPAHVIEVEVSKNKLEKKTCIYDWLPKKLPGKMNYSAYWVNPENFVLNVNDELKLIEIPIKTKIKEEVEMRETIRGILRELTLRVKYKDFYDNIIEDKTMKLHYFGRVDNVN